METQQVMPLENEVKECCIISRKSKITELLELCTQPENKKEMEAIVSKFWNQFEEFSGNENFCEFDICCMYALDYVYKENSECLAAISRTVFSYLDQNGLGLKYDDRNLIINCGNDCYLTRLRKFENFESEEGMVILVQSQISSLMSGNLAFAHFLVKFGLVDFPSEANEKSRKMIVELVSWFNMSYEYTISTLQGDVVPCIQVDELLNQMTRSEIGFRRCMLIFCTLCIVAEYGMYENFCMIVTPELDLNLFVKRMKSKYRSKMSCLDLYIDTTMETNITFKDMNLFTATILNPHLGTQFGKHLVETSRKILSEAHRYYNPRTLKDITRCKIRRCVPSSMMLTEHVNQFMIPETLKQYILFHSDEIWDLLIENQVHMHSYQLLNRRILEIQNAPDN